LEPNELGSGGWAQNPTVFDSGGDGGGRIWVKTRHLVNNGKILANGGAAGNIDAGGSGGAIRLDILGGVVVGTGSIRADRGNSASGYHGGGGRVSVQGFSSNFFTGTFSTNGTIYVPGVPKVSYEDGSTVLSWGLSFASFQVEVTTNVFDTGWTAINETPVLLDGHYKVTIANMSGTHRFFRMTHH
jgi:hypothetical protein